MALTESQMIDLGAEAPPFSLPAANTEVDERSDNETRALGDYAGAEALVVVFTCNHCPYAQHIEGALIEAARAYRKRGAQFVAISSNNAETHPEDSFEKMAERAEAKGYPFPYLYDESQETARAYGAVCTPDFFVFDEERKLAYRGRFDETRPGKAEAHGGDLRKALDELLQTGEVTGEQMPSIGCNIKWR